MQVKISAVFILDDKELDEYEIEEGDVYYSDYPVVSRSIDNLHHSTTI